MGKKNYKKDENLGTTQNYGLKGKDRRNVFVRGAIVCGVLLCVGAVIVGSVKNRPQAGKVAQVGNPKAITVKAGTQNTNNFTPVVSLDGQTVPVPKGYIASGVADERYVNGVNVTYKLQESLTLSSSGDYKWTQNETTGVWSSGNYQQSSTTSTIETNEFTVSETAAVRIKWSVCSEPEVNRDYAYYTITNTETNSIIGGIEPQESRIYGTAYGTTETSLIYVDKDILLEAGTYKVTITYSKNSNDVHKNLDKAYLKSIGVYTKSAGGSEITVREKSGGFVIYEGTEAVTDANVNTAKTTRNQYVWVPIASNEVEPGKMFHVTKGIIYANQYNVTKNGIRKTKPR